MGLNLRLTESIPLTAVVVGELSQADVELVGAVELGSKAAPLKELRARHHAIAKALADGMRPSIVAATFNYSISRVSILASDPTFQELIAHYRATAHADTAVMRERLVALGVDAIDEISDRLEDVEQRKEIGINALIKIVEMTADRTGHGKKAETEVNIHVGFADRLRAARERVAGASPIDRSATIIDA
jgi:hypothetical protein